MYEKYSQVSKEDLELRNIIKEKSKYQGLRLFDNLERNSTAKTPVSMVEYKEDFEGIISSYIDRLPFSERMYHQWVEEWDQYKSYIRVHPKITPETTKTALV